MMFRLLLLIFVCAVYAGDDPAWKNPSYSPIDNLDSAMRGYNMYIAEPFAASQIDPGYRQMIFESTKINSDRSVSLQSGVLVNAELSCRTSTRESIITSIVEYRNDQLKSTVRGTSWSVGPELEVNAEVGVGVAKVGVSKKIEPFIQNEESDITRLTKLEQFFNAEKGVMVKLEATCYKDKVMIARYNMPEFRPGFIASVRKLYEAHTEGGMEAEFKKFIKDYGTHYSSETYLGARLIYYRRYTEREHKVLTNKGLLDCSKQQTKISAFASVEDRQNMCGQVTTDSTTVGTIGVTREETISFGSRPHSESIEWAQHDLSNQVPIQQKLIPIHQLLNDPGQFGVNTTSSTFITEFLQLYDNICNVMNYKCQENVCEGWRNTCNFGQKCLKVWFPSEGQKNYYCENSKPMAHWRRNSKATGYTVRLFELGSPDWMAMYSAQCNREFCNTSFPQVEDTTKTFVYEVTPLDIKDTMPNSIGSDEWTPNLMPIITKPIEFHRIEAATGYYVNVHYLGTMSTYTHYVPQCDYVTHFTPEMICRDLPPYFLTQQARHDFWDMLPPMYGGCEAFERKFSSYIPARIVKMMEAIGYEPLVHPKCHFSFPAEPGEYDIMVVAKNITTSFIEKFSVKI